MLFTQQELEAAYKQMKDEREVDRKFAVLAAKKLTAALGGQRISYRHSDSSFAGFYPNHSSPSPHPSNYELWFEMSQYDGLPLNFKNIVSNYSRRMIVGRGQTWCGEYDLSNDLDFMNANQKVYRVAIDTYDAHACGY